MIKIKDIYKSYGEKENKVEVLKGINLNIEDGDFVVILGPSGSGKSTLLNIVSGLEKPDKGTVSYDEKEITKLNDKELTEFRKNNIGFIFQQYYLLQNLNVEKNVRMGADLVRPYNATDDEFRRRYELRNYKSGQEWKVNELRFQRPVDLTNQERS